MHDDVPLAEDANEPIAIEDGQMTDGSPQHDLQREIQTVLGLNGDERVLPSQLTQIHVRILSRALCFSHDFRAGPMTTTGLLDARTTPSVIDPRNARPNLVRPCEAMTIISASVRSLA